MPRLNAAEISKLLREIGDRMTLNGGESVPRQGVQAGRDNLALSIMPLERLIAEDRLTEIPGIGDALAAVITNLHKTGEHPSLEKMRAETPQGVLEMFRLPGLRPDRIQKTLHRSRHRVGGGLRRGGPQRSSQIHQGIWPRSFRRRCCRESR